MLQRGGEQASMAAPQPMPAVYMHGQPAPPSVVVISGGPHLGYHGTQQAPQLVVPATQMQNVAAPAAGK